MSCRPGWSPPPDRPTLTGGCVSVWLFGASTSRPLETVLARYLGTDVRDISLNRAAGRQPELAGSSIRMSLAHSGDVALVAVAGRGKIGVDVERRRASVDGWSLLRHALTLEEYKRLEQAPRGARADAFLSMWTRKEALLKAVGTGLKVDPRLVELGVNGEVIALPESLGTAREWTLTPIPLPGYLAAVAYEGTVRAVELYDAIR